MIKEIEVPVEAVELDLLIDRLCWLKDLMETTIKSWKLDNRSMTKLLSIIHNEIVLSINDSIAWNAGNKPNNTYRAMDLVE